MPGPTKTSRLTPDYSFDTRLGVGGRYRDARGRIVRTEVVLEAMEQSITASRRAMNRASRELAEGDISIAQWQLRMRDEVVTVHLTSTALSRGGWAQMTQSDYGWAGSKIKKQLRFLERFAVQIENGKQPLLNRNGDVNGQFLQRTDLYGHAGASTYQDAKRREALADSLANVERRRLDPGAQHCKTRGGLLGCVELADKGWQPIGSSVAIGHTPCNMKCRCNFEFGVQDNEGKVKVIAA